MCLNELMIWKYTHLLLEWLKFGIQLLIVSRKKWLGGNICICVPLSIITLSNVHLASSGWQREIGSRLSCIRDQRSFNFFLFYSLQSQSGDQGFLAHCCLQCCFPCCGWTANGTLVHEKKDYVFK